MKMRVITKKANNRGGVWVTYQFLDENGRVRGHYRTFFSGQGA